MADTIHLISDYGDTALLWAVIRCWRARAEALQKLPDREGVEQAARYDRGARLIEEAIKAVK